MVCRIAAGGFAVLAASVLNASAQSCLFPGTCQEPRSFAERVNARQSVKNNLPSQKGSPHIAQPDPRRLSAAESHQRLSDRKLLDQEKVEPLVKEFRQEQRQENRSSTRTEQAARDALFDEFLRWQVHQVLGE
jgi:hypothetical protein